MDSNSNLSETVNVERRPIKTREQPWARALAFFFVRIGLSPNQMSVGSIVWALSGFACLLGTRQAGDVAESLLLAASAAAIQLRLLCNMLDGLMAVEGGRMTPTGLLYNECPDRIADALFLVGAGHACAWTYGPMLGWLAALMAVLTAYVRLLGGSCGLKQDFCGPMSKPHRMFVLTLSCLAAAGESLWRGTTVTLAVGLGIIITGSLMTCLRRLGRIAGQLKARP